MAEVSKPRFSHDCGHCQYLGQIASEDVYFCPSDKEVILRNGDRGEQYRAMPQALLDRSETIGSIWQVAASMTRQWIMDQ